MYLLDTNVFIQAKNLHYGFDFCPAFWEWLIWKNNEGKVFSIEKVGDEIHSGDDDLAVWAKSRGSDFFLPPDASMASAFGRLSEWVYGQNYEPVAVNTFLQVADYYLVVHALTYQCTVVTHEIPSGSLRKIKIPDVCMGLGIRCISPYEMLRNENARFVLGR